MELFEKAEQTYTAAERVQPQLLGGLYNNMALVCVADKRFDEADAYYKSIPEFFMEKIGSADGRLTEEQWLLLPEYALAEEKYDVIGDASLRNRHVLSAI